jgi:hypothetical protein
MGTLVVIALCAVLGGGQLNGKESIRIYVFATEMADRSTTPDQPRQNPGAAVRDMRDAIRHTTGLSVVDDRAQADVIVEITAVDQQEGDGGFGGIKLTPLVTTTIRLHVTSGDHQTDLKGTGPGTGSRAAKDAADRLLKWIARNHLDRTSGTRTRALVATAHPCGVENLPLHSL